MTTSLPEGKGEPPSFSQALRRTLVPVAPESPPRKALSLLSVRLPAYVLLLFFALLQAFYNLNTGFWEGGETDRAQIALALQFDELRWFAPLVDGQLAPISWLEMLLLQLGGHSEFLMRLPFLALTMVSLLVLTNIVAQHFGRWTTAFTVALAAATPLVIFGGTSLHGYAAVVAPIGMATLMMAHYSALREDYPIARGIVLGLGFGLSYLAWGVLGAAIPVTTGLLLSWTRGTVAPSLRTVLISTVVAMTIVAVPTFPFIAVMGIDVALPYLLWPPLVAAESAHSFDVLIRLLGFSCFPLLAFFPFALAWFASRLKDEEDDFLSPPTLFVLGLFIAATCTLTIVGVAHAFRPTPVVPLPLILAPLAAVSLSGSWRKNLTRSASYLTLMTSAFLLLLTARDLRGTYSSEEGRPGPFVLLEPLLDGSTGFNESYRLPGLFGLAALTLVLLLIGYSDVPSRIRDLQRLLEANAKPGEASSRLYRFLERWRVRTLKIVQQLSMSRIAVGIALIATMQAVLITQVYLPTYGELVSDRRITERTQALRGPNEALYLVAADNADERFYLRGRDAWIVDSLGELEQRFCQSQERVFALLTPLQAQNFYMTMRRTSKRPTAYCPQGSDVFFLDEQPHNLVLVSNALNPENEAPVEALLARSILGSEQQLPPDLLKPSVQHTIGGALEFLGSTVTPTEITLRGEIVIRSYWRVKRPPPANWEMLTHLDNGPNRINADHFVAQKQLPLPRLMNGDIFVDEHRVPISILGERRGTYQIFLGFFHDETRMEVDPPVPFHRIPAGSFELRAF